MEMNYVVQSIVYYLSDWNICLITKEDKRL
jgi:hypothetical protein